MPMLGLRRSEVCGLRWEEIDLEQQTMRVAQSVRLTHMSPLHPRVVMEIVGHSGIEATMNVSGHINPRDPRRALDDPAKHARNTRGCQTEMSKGAQDR